MEMADEKWKIAGDLCRCCLAVGSHNKLGIAKFNDKASGDNEDFANMLLENLGLTLLPVKCVLSEITYTICNPCVERLRDAVSFRKQVQLSEEKFWNMYGRNMLIAIEPIVVKVEDVEPEDAYKGASDDDFNMDDFSDDDTKLNFIEIKAETKKSKGKAKAGIKGTATKKPPTRKMAARKTKTKSMMDAESVKAQKQKVKTVKTEAIKTEEEEEGSPAEETKPPVKRKKGEVVNQVKYVDFTIEGDKFKCTRCGKLYPRKGNLTEHNNIRHTHLEAGIRKGKDCTQIGNEYACSHCETRHAKQSGIRGHVLSVHLNLPPKTSLQGGYSCPACPMSFSTEAPFITHKLEAHKIDDRHSCNACGSVFLSRSGFQAHTETYHMLGKKLKCKLCDYKCFNASNLYKHKFKHRDLREFRCRFCTKSFMRKTTMQCHERIHTGDKRKVCEVCKQAFVQKASLNYHMMKHHPEVPF